jgi:hypothetical protein
MIQIIRILLDCQLEIDFSLDLLGLYDQRVVITNLSSLQPLILDNQWKLAASRYFIQSVNWYYFNDRAIDYLKYLHNAHLPKFCSTFYYQLMRPMLRHWISLLPVIPFSIILLSDLRP